MDLIRAIQLILPEIGRCVCQRFLMRESFDYGNEIEVLEAKRYIFKKIQSGKVSKASLRLLIKNHFQITLGKAVMLINELFEKVSLANVNKTTHVLEDINNDGLISYLNGEFSSAKKLWRHVDVNIQPYDYKPSINYEISRWRLGEIQPLEIIRFFFFKIYYII